MKQFKSVTATVSLDQIAPPMLNLGCGKVILPAERPWHHGLVPEEIYGYPKWHNVDKVPSPGVNQLVDVFAYPWPWPDNTFNGALAAHLVEHIPHDIRLYADDEENIAAAGYWSDKPDEWRARREELRGLQDGWFAFFSELHRVLLPGAVAHIVAPHGASDGALADPTHTRYVMPHTFDYLCNGDDAEDAPFVYRKGGRWELGQILYHFTQLFSHLMPADGDDDVELQRKFDLRNFAMMTARNAVYEFYAPMKVIKG